MNPGAPDGLLRSSGAERTDSKVSVSHSSTTALPTIPDHELLKKIGGGSYGEVWLARNTKLGAFRAIKIIRRAAFERQEPFDREFKGIQNFEPISRSHDGLV